MKLQIVVLIHPLYPVWPLNRENYRHSKILTFKPYKYSKINLILGDPEYFHSQNISSSKVNSIYKSIYFQFLGGGDTSPLSLCILDFIILVHESVTRGIASFYENLYTLKNN